MVLSACGGDQAGDGAGDGDADGAAQPSAGPTATAGVTASARPAADEPEVAPADLANFSCVRQGDGRWKATGDITNSTDRPMVYTVTVVTTDADAKVLGERVKSFTIEPEQSKSFTWPQFFRGSADTCMPHVQRKPA
jgi:hypothetical protein